MPTLKTYAIYSLIALSSLASTAVSAKGCLKGAAVGGVAGHVAGHHSVLGAAAGCAIGRHRANKQDKADAAAAQKNAGATNTSVPPAPAK
jgi:hypothetical protein